MPHALRHPLLLPILIAAWPWPVLAATVTPGEAWVAHDQVLRLPVAGLDLPPPGALRAFIGSTEVTPMLRRPGGGLLELAPRALPWPAGEHQLVLQDGRDWREIGRWPLKVRTAAGFERSTLQPRLHLGMDSRAAEQRSDGQAFSPRGSHADVATQAGLAWNAARDGWQVEAGFNGSGNSHRAKTLRHGELAERAPKLDLADYRVAIAHGDPARYRAEFGHLSARSHPLLAQDLSRRGLALHGSLGAGGELGLYLLNGTQIVGWDNLLGLEEAEHRVQMLSWGLELLPERPGGLRADIGLLDASLLPRRDFNAAQVPDAEHSRGLSLRLAGLSANGRLRGELAFARSRFVNPYDPLLALGGELQPVRAVTRNAYSAELHAVLLQPPSESPAAPSLAVHLRHEQAAPLYRSLAAAVTPDQRLSRIGAQFGWAGAALALQWQQRVDNLDRVATLLRTRTDDGLMTLSLPLPRWLGATGPSAWPSVNLSLQRLHQRAANLPPPEASGFAASQRPDQVNGVQQLQLGWVLPRGAFGWQVSRTTLDNRQPGREQADARSLGQTWQLSWAFDERWQAQAGLSRSRQLNVETAITQRIAGATLGLDWRPDERWSFGGQGALNRGRDSSGLASSQSASVQLHAARRFDLPGIDKPLPAQLTLRLAHQAERQRDDRFGLAVDWRGWWVDIGLAVGFF